MRKTEEIEKPEGQEGAAESEKRVPKELAEMIKKHGMPPEYLLLAAGSMAVILQGLGYSSQKVAAIVQRGNEFSSAASKKDYEAAIGEDLDNWSVAVGFAAALGVYSTCSGWAAKDKSTFQKLVETARGN